MNIRPYAHGSEEDWIERINSILPSTVRVLNRYTLTSDMQPKEIHAEVSCTQYRYEYMLPLRLIMPTTLLIPEDQDEGGSGSVTTWLEQAAVTRRKVYHRNESKHQSNNGIHSMDQEFPFETAEGQQRVAFFRNLKRISKGIAGRKSFHNFASGGASPEDTVSFRKIDRIYHKELVSINNEPWVVFSISGDGFLRGQVRRVLGAMIAMARGLLPENYLELCINKSFIAEVPALPGWGLYLAECKYAYYEAKFENFKLDPRRSLNTDCSRLDAWKTTIHAHIAGISQQVGDSWLKEYEENCQKMVQNLTQMQALMSRPRCLLEEKYQARFGYTVPVKEAIPLPTTTTTSSTTLSDGAEVFTEIHSNVKEEEQPVASSTVCAQKDATAPAVYAKVLRLLQEADASGLWPANSTGRQKVIVNAPAAALAKPDSELDLQTNTAVVAAVVGDDEAAEVATLKRAMLAAQAADDNVNTENEQPQTEQNREKAPRKQRVNKASNKAARNKKAKTETTTTTTETPEAAADDQNDSLRSSPAEQKPRKTSTKKQNNNEEENNERPPLQPAHRKATEAAVELVSDAGVGGSFSVGCLPKHLAQPRGNTLFPGTVTISDILLEISFLLFFCCCLYHVYTLLTELMKACFELERAICPHRPPSSTIAINRHAQFSPHRDSGAGSGQSKSLIVALGDFIGGEIAVESTAHDIRYQPLEFDGWMERHYTLPFVGERYSLVWFTPLGITADDLWWWKDEESAVVGV